MTGEGSQAGRDRSARNRGDHSLALGLRQTVENNLTGKIPVTLFSVDVGGKDGSPESI